jgi:RNA polymerase sigma-70 factor (ECF subfamily)
MPSISASIELGTRPEADRQSQRDTLFLCLVRDYDQAIFRYLYGVLGDREAAQDLAQDVFVKAQRSLHSLRDPERARYWLFAIATNTARQHLRRASILRWLPLSALDHAAAAPARADISDEIGLFVSEVLGQLGDKDRMILLLCGLHEFTAAEAGLALGISEGAAKKRWQRARDRFLQLAGGQDELDA